MTAQGLEAAPRSERSSEGGGEGRRESWETPRPYEKHRAVSERATGNEWHDTTLERRADGLEEVLHRAPSDSALLDDTLTQVMARVDDPRAFSPKDRVAMPAALHGQDANEQVRTLITQLREQAPAAPTLASVMSEVASGARPEQQLALKALGSRILQLYAPEHSRDRWGSERFGAGRQQRVRLGEMLILSAQIGEVVGKMRETKGLDQENAKRYYARFMRYAGNHDVPASFRKQLVDTTDFLEQRYPLLKNPPKEARVTRLADKERAFINRKAQQVYQKFGRTYEEARARREAQSDTVIEAEIVEEAATKEAAPSLIVGPEHILTMDQPQLQERLRRLTEGRLDTPARRQAYEWLEQWRARGLDIAASTLRVGLDRYTAPTPEREKKRQRYLNIMQNELGYLDTRREGGVLNNLTSNWMESLYARVAVNPYKPWRWFGARGRADVMQARSDMLESMRAAVADPHGGIDEGHKMAIMELSDRYEELQIRERLRELPAGEVGVNPFVEPPPVHRQPTEATAPSRPRLDLRAHVERQAQMRPRLDLRAYVEREAQAKRQAPEQIAHVEQGSDEVGAGVDVPTEQAPSQEVSGTTVEESIAAPSPAGPRLLDSQEVKHYYDERARRVAEEGVSATATAESDVGQDVSGESVAHPESSERDQLVERAYQDGRIAVSTSWPRDAKVLGRTARGNIETVVDSRVEKPPQTYERNLNEALHSETATIAQNSGVDEVVYLAPPSTAYMQNELGDTSWNVTYKLQPIDSQRFADYTGRSNTFTATITVPEAIGRQILEATKQDPSFIRHLIARFDSQLLAYHTFPPHERMAVFALDDIDAIDWSKRQFNEKVVYPTVQG